ncbi:MAG: tetratricopeptide repeat protein [SAR202 cluster bacterium]|nr:tetratricopeptide repeat protein [SAR202 cluster bacterium]|tara:strand:+ start:232 stop:819 length:588 start_codon:yes stop_codon:yes gene_type:complete
MIKIKVKNIFVCFLAITLVISVLASCTKDTDIDLNSIPSPEPTTKSTDLVQPTVAADNAQAVAKDVLFDYLRAQSLLGAAMYKEAIGSYNVVLKILPDLYLAYHGRALAYYKEGMVERALEDFDRAIEIKPDYASALRNRGVVYANEGMFTQACADLNKAVRLYESKLGSGEEIFNQEKYESDLRETMSQIGPCR